MYLWLGFTSHQNWVMAASLWNALPSTLTSALMHSLDLWWTGQHHAATEMNRLFFWEQTITEVNLAMKCEFAEFHVTKDVTAKRGLHPSEKSDGFDTVLIRRAKPLWIKALLWSPKTSAADNNTQQGNNTFYLCASCQRWQPPAAESTCFSKVSHLRPRCCSTQCNMVPASQRCDLLKQSSVETAPRAAGGLRGRGPRLIGCPLLFSSEGEDKHRL